MDAQTYAKFIALLMQNDAEAALDSARVRAWGADLAHQPTRKNLAADAARGRSAAAFSGRYPEAAQRIKTV